MRHPATSRAEKSRRRFPPAMRQPASGVDRCFMRAPINSPWVFVFPTGFVPFQRVSMYADHPPYRGSWVGQCDEPRRRRSFPLAGTAPIRCSGKTSHMGTDDPTLGGFTEFRGIGPPSNCTAHRAMGPSWTRPCNALSVLSPAFESNPRAALARVPGCTCPGLSCVTTSACE